MTLIIADAKNKRIIADRLLTDNDYAATVNKTFYTDDGVAWGSAGTPDNRTFTDWYNAGADQADCPLEKNAHYLGVDADGNIRFISFGCDISPQGDFYAIGSGAGFALGMLHVGVVPETVMTRVSEICTSVGGGHDILESREIDPADMVAQIGRVAPTVQLTLECGSCS